MWKNWLYKNRDKSLIFMSWEEIKYVPESVVNYRPGWLISFSKYWIVDPPSTPSPVSKTYAAVVRYEIFSRIMVWNIFSKHYLMRLTSSTLNLLSVEEVIIRCIWWVIVWIYMHFQIFRSLQFKIKRILIGCFLLILDAVKVSENCRSRAPPL